MTMSHFSARAVARLERSIGAAGTMDVEADSPLLRVEWEETALPAADAAAPTAGSRWLVLSPAESAVRYLCVTHTRPEWLPYRQR